MKKDDLVYVGHMLDMVRKALVKVQVLDRSHYDADENLRMALVHLIQTIGEAARRVSPEFRESHADIPWRNIIGMRHKVVHDYMQVDFDLVWDVATGDLPPLKKQLERLVQE